MNIEENLEKARALEKDGIWEFAQVNKVNFDVFNDSTSATFATGTVRKLAVGMENALSMAFYFEQFHIPVGAALFIVSEGETAGPFTHENAWSNGDFQTRHIRGRFMEVHYFEEVTVRERPVLRLSVVTTAFRAAHDGNQNAGTCNINSVCVAKNNECNKKCKATEYGCSVECTYIDQDPNKGQWAGSDWDPQIRGTVAVGRNYASRYCSGSFINNKDGKQYVLTAAHCGPAGADIIQMNFANPDCASDDDEAGPTEYVAGDLKTLARDTSIDNELIEVGEAIPDDWEVYLNGYEAGDKDKPATGAVGIHHPSGANKKISFFADKLTLASWSGSSTLNHWKVEEWTVSTTEPGSSGSPLFRHDTKRIVGQLHGGSASCPAKNGYDVYGAVWAGYNTGGMKE